ncbi:MAG: J domain-containing protein [Halolamina sp.]
MSPLSSFPRWLLVGVALGVVASVVVAAVFVLGNRLFPDGGAAESTRTDGNARRRAEIGRYFERIGEPFVRDRRFADREVAFYLPERDVAVTFDVETYFALESRDTEVVLCEYEMPASALGRRLPFEVPTVESVPAAPTDAAVTRAFARLGVAADADAETVETAYRERVKAVHPDQGGDPEEFRAVREAYATAKDHLESVDDGGEAEQRVT